MQTEVPIQVQFRGELIGVFRADLVVNESILLELKTCNALVREHESQTLNYLRATNIEVALLMNFGPTARFKRLVLSNDLKRSKDKSVSIGVKPFQTVPEVNQ